MDRRSLEDVKDVAFLNDLARRTDAADPQFLLPHPGRGDQKQTKIAALSQISKQV
jgi:hypothetical protein